MADESKIAIKLEEETKPIKKMCEKLMDAVNHELDKGIENVNAEELGEIIDMIKDLYEAKEKMYKACYYKQIMEAMEESEYGEDYDEYGPMDDGRRGYRGQPRDSRGRYMSRRGRGKMGYEEPMTYRMTPDMYRQMPVDWERDMDREGMGRMYYSGSGSSGGQSSGGSGMSGGNMGGSSSGSSGGSRGYSDGNYGGSDGNRGGGNSRYENARRGYEEKKSMGADKQEKMKSLEEYMKELGSDLSGLLAEMSPEEKSMVKSKLSMLAQKVS